MRYYGYEEFRDDTKKLIEELKTYEPEAVVAIARGGLTLAHSIAEGMGIRDVQSIRTELYDATEKRDCITLFGSLELQLTKRVLIVDDIADSGETLDVVMRDLKEDYPRIEFRSATLFYKSTSKIEPDFWINEANDWIDFFWERDFKE